MCRTSRCLAPDASVDAPDTGRVDCVADENVRRLYLGESFTL